MASKIQIGDVFGRLTVLEHAGSNNLKRRTWICRCECGATIESCSDKLNRGVTKSCGCLRREVTRSKRWAGIGDLPQSYWGSLIRNAKSRNLDVLLTMEEAWALFEEQGGRCALSNQPISLTSDQKRYYYGTASLDRKDSSKHYTLDNVWWIHKTINHMKMDYALDEFIKMCVLIADAVDTDKKCEILGATREESSNGPISIDASS